MPVRARSPVENVGIDADVAPSVCALATFLSPFAPGGRSPFVPDHPTPSAKNPAITRPATIPEVRSFTASSFTTTTRLRQPDTLRWARNVWHCAHIYRPIPQQPT